MDIYCVWSNVFVLGSHLVEHIYIDIFRFFGCVSDVLFIAFIYCFVAQNVWWKYLERNQISLPGAKDLIRIAGILSPSETVVDTFSSPGWSIGSTTNPAGEIETTSRLLTGSVPILTLIWNTSPFSTAVFVDHSFTLVVAATIGGENSRHIIIKHKNRNNIHKIMCIAYL